MFDLKNWKRFSGTFAFNETTPIDKVTLEIVAEDAVIRNGQNQNVPAHITDVHFQAGQQLTGWEPNTREVLEKLKHTNDEFRMRVTPEDIYLGGKSPVKYVDLEHRIYNIAGRGNEVFVVPNYYPEDYSVPNITTGIDVEIIPKNDYDFFRFCTNEGSQKPTDELYDSRFLDHPLNRQYTREFAIGAGLAGVPIKILASQGKAYRGSSRVHTGGVYHVTVDGKRFPIKNRHMFLAPRGSVRYRIEFYKLDTRYIDSNGNRSALLATPILVDTGIGYSGTIKFNQWKYGRSRF